MRDSPTDAERYLDVLSLGTASNGATAFVREAGESYKFIAANTTCQLEPSDIPDYAGWPGAKGSGRCITIGLYDTNRLREYKELLRVPPLPGSVYLTHGEEHSSLLGTIDAKALGARSRERRERGIAIRGRALIGG